MSRRDQIRMTPDEVRAFLSECRDLQVASLNADGSPHLVTMWYALDGDRICFWTYAKSQKVLNLRRDPRVAVLVAVGDRYEDLRGVSINGRAEITADPEAVRRVGEAVYERYWGPVVGDEVRDVVARMGAKRVAVRVLPERVVSWDHRKLGGVY